MIHQTQFKNARVEMADKRLRHTSAHPPRLRYEHVKRDVAYREQRPCTIANAVLFYSPCLQGRA